MRKAKEKPLSLLVCFIVSMLRSKSLKGHDDWDYGLAEKEIDCNSSSILWDDVLVYNEIDVQIVWKESLLYHRQKGFERVSNF